MNKDIQKNKDLDIQKTKELEMQKNKELDQINKDKESKILLDKTNKDILDKSLMNNKRKITDVNLDISGGDTDIRVSKISKIEKNITNKIDKNNINENHDKNILETKIDTSVNPGNPDIHISEKIEKNEIIGNTKNVETKNVSLLPGTAAFPTAVNKQSSAPLPSVSQPLTISANTGEPDIRKISPVTVPMPISTTGISVNPGDPDIRKMLPVTAPVPISTTTGNLDINNLFSSSPLLTQKDKEIIQHFFSENWSQFFTESMIKKNPTIKIKLQADEKVCI